MSATEEEAEEEVEEWSGTLEKKKDENPRGQNQDRTGENRPPQLAAKTLTGKKLK